ncbi:hypothetical protein D8674_019233 [Pyrus ussuriensis x Pyrus communis]|uniref:Uncharacterized protein n=1 Tax=Pyrus ussuriensis x Pyrus communis TaxID=2448454 RepID=A0A5N5GBR9_9ROSA|nr:hypothetical protein D8674_019233 [Pyrus ussuriensis x Pyrus communis]
MMVARDATMFVREWQFPALVLEVDALLGMAGLKNEGSDDTSHFGNILNDTRSIIHSLPTWKGDEQGGTQASAFELELLTWFEEPLDIILDLLFEDSNS